MRIKALAVHGLFRLFNHVVPLNLESMITIIHGPNGFGKTTILKMLSSVMTGRYWELRTIPFSTFSIEFDDGHTLRTVQSIDPHAKPGSERNLDISLVKNNKEVNTVRIKPLSRETLDFPLSAIDDFVPELVRQSQWTWRNMETGEILSIEDVLERYGDALPRVDSEIQKEAEWLKELRGHLKVRFIESERLTRLGKRAVHRPRTLERTRPAVLVFSEELANEIQKALAAYGELSQRLDRTFPMRLVQQIQRDTLGPSSEILTKKLVDLEKKRATLRGVGLLEKEDEKFEYPETRQDLTQQVLPVYVQDTEEKLAVFDEIAAKIETLKEIVNSRFTFKHLEILKGEGFHFSSTQQNPLRVTHLSSGEQHMLVLLFELLFSVKPNSLVLIDEPEISLHVGWQHQFLEDVQRVASLSSIDILIATHSPQIINNRWSLTVELQPPAESK